ARGVRSRPLGLPRAALSKVKRVEMQRHEGGYYIRLAVFDKPGAFAGIAARMAERGISLESIVQRGRGGDQAGAPVPVVLITYATTEKLVREALDAIMADGFVAERPQSIRIERE
ncbi:MAG: ACT domain-containing protein, partial [Hyphomicrobiales bacterium]|nr:ACT domain-containing protein [Hyphomicrobiales bacterium]